MTEQIDRTHVVRILLVEDDEDDYVLVRDLLDDFLWARPSLTWIDGYESAINVMALDQHDVYLLDLRLGAENGIDLLREAIARGCKGPIVLLTGQGDRETDLAAMESGAVDYLIKDSMSGQLLERSIRYAIYRKQAERELSEIQRRLAESQELERLRLAQELHDSPLQELLGARLHLGALKSQLPQADLRSRVDFILENIQGVVDTLRTLCGELRPPALDPFGLARAIRSHARSFEHTHTGCKVRLRLDDDRQGFDSAQGLAFFRIYQNAMSNIAKHAGASHVDIELTISDELVRLTVRDDGCGFDVPNSWVDLAREGHYGLLGASERADAMHGHLEVWSDRGTGTTLTVVVPLQALQSTKDGPSNG